MVPLWNFGAQVLHLKFQSSRNMKTITNRFFSLSFLGLRLKFYITLNCAFSLLNLLQILRKSNQNFNIIIIVLCVLGTLHTFTCLWRLRCKLFLIAHFHHWIFSKFCNDHINFFNMIVKIVKSWQFCV
jgi:hypothetical protein